MSDTANVLGAACGPQSRTSRSASFLVAIFVCGHSVSSCIKNAGPIHQSSLSIRVQTRSPLVNRSAGFCIVGTCLHCSGSLNDCISPTRFVTKGLNTAPRSNTTHPHYLTKITIRVWQDSERSCRPRSRGHEFVRRHFHVTLSFWHEEQWILNHCIAAFGDKQ